MDLNRLVDDLRELSVLEAAELSKFLEEKWGVSAAAAVAAAGNGAASIDDQAAFDVILTTNGGHRLAVIKELHAITALGLSEAKALMESAPAPVTQNVSQDQAKRVKERLENAGATISIVPSNVARSGSTTADKHEVMSRHATGSTGVIRLLILSSIGILLAYAFGPLSPIPDIKAVGWAVLIGLPLMGLIAAVWQTARAKVV